MSTIKLALSTDNYDRFVLLQGQDYPLFSPQEIHDFFDSNVDVEFCKAKNISASKSKKDYMKCCGLWLMDISHPSFIAKCFRYFIHKFNSLGIKYRTSTFKNGKEKWSIYHGWAQFALTKNCIKYILDVYENNASYNKYMKYRFPPDEIYIHTIIHRKHSFVSFCFHYSPRGGIVKLISVPQVGRHGW